MNNYNRQSIRLRNYDYASAGWYFLTICCFQKQPVFGSIQTQKITLSTVGEVARQEWLLIPKFHPNIKLHEYVFMPNHMHAILEIRKPEPGSQSKSLGQIIRGYKSAVTSRSRTLTSSDSFSIWQRNYYEHIIRNEASYLAITQYILDNPKKWHEDEYFV